MAELLSIDKLLAALCTHLRANYILPEMASQICANLESHHQAGATQTNRFWTGELLAGVLQRQGRARMSAAVNARAGNNPG
jgi:hypothetical protein